MVRYGQPRRINSVTFAIVLMGAAAGYWLWRFFPAYFDAWTVDHILKETASSTYKLSRLGEPERGKQLKVLVDRARAEIIEQGHVTDPDLLVNLDIDGDNVAVRAEYNVAITHPVIEKATLLRFRRVETANIKKVQWE